MKAQFKTLYILCFALGILTATSCKKEPTHGDSIILLGMEEYVEPIAGFIPDTLRTHFINHFGTMPEGYIPPNIEGEYLIGRMKFCHSNHVAAGDGSNMHLRITNQHNRVAHVEFDDKGTVVVDTAFIMGNGQRFTLYFTEEKHVAIQGEFSIKRSVFITGEKTLTGIKDLRFGSIILEANDDGNVFVGGFKPGWYFIYQDEDGISENCNWFNDNEEGGNYE